MPSKKRKYNARFPAGRIKKIMQTDEEVGKVAQAVPIIISRTLEMFVESLLSKAMQVTMARNAKTLSPSHVKQCILGEARFDFLRDLVKNIPDISAAEEKEMQMSAESSPNSSRFSDSTAPRRIVREDSNSSSSCDVRVQALPRDSATKDPLRDNPPQPDLPRETVRETLKRTLSAKADISITKPRIETVNLPVSSTIVSSEAIDLTKKKEPRTANFYQETLVDSVQHKSVIQLNPTYFPQPSTSNSYANLTPVPVPREVKIEMPKPEIKPLFNLDLRQNNNVISMTPPRTPVTPVINIDFSKNLSNPEIKVLDSTVPNLPQVAAIPHIQLPVVREKPKLQRQNSKVTKTEIKKDKPPPVINIDHINSGNLQIDEDYDT